MKNKMLCYALYVASLMFLAPLAYANNQLIAYCPDSSTLKLHATGIVTAPGGWTSASVITSTKSKNASSAPATYYFLGGIIGEGPSPLSGATQAASCSYLQNNNNQVELYSTKYNAAHTYGGNWYLAANGASCSSGNGNVGNCPFSYTTK